LSTKIHATVDASGNPTGFHLTPGQACDLEGADALLSDIPAQAMIADKTYDADERVIESLKSAGKPGRHPAQGKPQRATPLRQASLQSTGI